MGREYFNQEDAIMRLNRSICVYHGHPYYVTFPEPRFEVVEGREQLKHPNPNEVVLWKLGKLNSPFKTVAYTDDEFSYKPPQLGYMMYQGDTYYLARMPHRRQVQGLQQQLIIGGPNNRNNWFTSKEMEDCIVGDHETEERARKLLSERPNEYRSVSFHRHAAITRLNRFQTALCYRGNVVGTGELEQNSYTLLKSRETSFLQRILSGIGVNV